MTINYLSYLIIGLIFITISYFINYVFDNKKFNNKIASYRYECGIYSYKPIIFFFRKNIYIYILLFMLLDIEIIVLFPCIPLLADSYKLNINYNNINLYYKILIFILPLVLGIIFIILKGKLNWYQNIKKNYISYSKISLKIYRNKINKLY